MSLYDRVSGLRVTIEAHELEANDREYGPFTRGSTIVHLEGKGEQGLGEDVVYEVLDHVALRDASGELDFAGESTLGDLCERIGATDLFPGAPPERETSRHYRRWAFESAALDLALRQNSTSLHEALGLDPHPVTFVCSTRLSSFGEDAEPSSTEPIRKRLSKHPDLRFKLDPENDWTPELIAEIRELCGVDVLDLKGLYRGTPVDVETDPELYAAVAEAFPEAYLEDPDVNDETRPVLDPYADRITWDALLHSLDDVEQHARKAINSKPSRFGSIQELFSIYEYCDGHGIAIYSGGQGELGVGRGQIQYLASLFHPNAPNDCAPSGYNDPAVPDGLPDSPLEPRPAAAGFRWES